MNRLHLSILRGFEIAKSRLSSKQFLFISAIIVGLLVGWAVVFLKSFVHLIFITTTSWDIGQRKYFYVFLPTLGILLTILVIKKVLNGNLQKGISHIIYAIVKKSSTIPRQQTYSQILTSSLTVGFGGSVGLEAPSVITGAALGANYADLNGLGYRDKTLLLACGVAASIGAAFNAPIAGVLFTFEVFLIDISISAFTSIIIASVAGALSSKIILKEGILLSFELTEPFNYHNVPYYFILGILAGMVSVYYARMFKKVESTISTLSLSVYQKALLGGCLLGILILFFPPLFGEGYQSIKNLSLLKPESLLNHSFLQPYQSNDILVLLFVGVLIFIKPIASGLTLGSGGNGGNFAPSLFVGAYLGYFFAALLNICHIKNLPINNFTIVGMAGILSGLYHAPLTAIFLIAEITGGYTLMIPLMIVSSIAYAISKYLQLYSMDTQSLAHYGAVFTHDRDHNILTTLKTKDLVETNFQRIHLHTTFEEFLIVIVQSKRNIFPVVDEEGKLLGIILLDDIRHLVVNPEDNKHIKIKTIMTLPPAIVRLNDSMGSVMEKFDKLQVWNLPVVDNDQYVGFISKSGILSLYRNQLKDLTII
jgi:CIC family chloride channel protein